MTYRIPANGSQGTVTIAGMAANRVDQMVTELTTLRTELVQLGKPVVINAASKSIAAEPVALSTWTRITSEDDMRRFQSVALLENGDGPTEGDLDLWVEQVVKGEIHHPACWNFPHTRDSKERAVYPVLATYVRYEAPGGPIYCMFFVRPEDAKYLLHVQEEIQDGSQA